MEVTDTSTTTTEGAEEEEVDVAEREGAPPFGSTSKALLLISRGDLAFLGLKNQNLPILLAKLK